MNILELVQKETGHIFRCKGTEGKEYAGPCPFCQAGDDRFILWPKEGRYWCRICGRKGDTIQFVMDYKHFTFAQAKKYIGDHGSADIIHNNDNNHNAGDYHNCNNQPSNPPPLAWQDPACDFILDCAYHLMGSSEGDKARAWLHQRTLGDAILHKYRIGYNPTDHYVERSAWGLPPEKAVSGRDKQLWLPKGIVIPWWVDGDLWGIRIRRPTDDPKYYWLPGGTPALYNADTMTANQAAVLLEGEIDALTAEEGAGDLAAAVATGSTHGARRMKWLARLATASIVLVANDTDEAGEKASAYWLEALPNARRWRPYWGDANGMAQDGVDVRQWILAGLTYFSDSK